ncbi:MAG: flagellar biosynthesis protein FlhF [Gammaproteobacteria bacterium]|nr:flagellar biosynthesis protein FlhF [Gammaproteobacteria bacterium]
MKIKRVIAKDMRQGIRRVREELGEDAVILSNRKVDEGVEIVVGIDYDEASYKADKNTIVTEDEQLDIFQIERPKQVVNSKTEADFRNAIDSAAMELERDFSAPYDAELTYKKPEKTHLQKAPTTTKANKHKSTADSQLFDEMRDELKSLRGILENQVNGLAWGEMTRNRPHQATLLKRYLDMGVTSDLAQSLSERVAEEEDLESAWRMSLDMLASEIHISNEDFIAEGGVVALVGPTGVGKTTTVAKLAARYALQHGYQQVALVTTDSYRIGAHEQLRTYGRILGVPVRVANDADELRTVLEHLSDKRLVLIDTAGMSQRDLRLTEQFNQVLSGAPKLKTCVVLSANTQTAAVKDVMRAFAKVKLDACVLTKLDECVSIGGVLSVIAQHKLPVAYLSDGQQVPEDLHRAHSHTLINRAQALLQQVEANTDEQLAAMAMGGVNPYAN